MSPASSQSSQLARAPRRAIRQRIHKEPPALAVPDINDDAAERKRVLNVLAQRRYRQRKKQQPLTEGHSSSDQEVCSRASNLEPGQMARSQTLPTHERGQHTHNELADAESASLMKSSDLNDDGDSFGMFIGSDWMLAGLGGIAGITGPSSLSLDTSPENLAVNSNSFGDLAFDSIYFTHLPGSSSLPSSPSLLGSEETSGGREPLLFPDTYLLPVPELTLVRALLRIADRLGCTSTIWDISTLSPFNGPGGCVSAADLLPENWRPTPTQTKVPHHPALDLVPWPSARDRLIGIFDLPESMRPPSAAGPLGLVHFVYDLEDASEGLRMYGGDPYDPGCWEVGQTLFQKWWFVFDLQIVNQSNHWRSLRGADKLRLKAASARPGSPQTM